VGADASTQLSEAVSSLHMLQRRAQKTAAYLHDTSAYTSTMVQSCQDLSIQANPMRQHNASHHGCM